MMIPPSNGNWGGMKPQPEKKKNEDKTPNTINIKCIKCGSNLYYHGLNEMWCSNKFCEFYKLPPELKEEVDEDTKEIDYNDPNSDWNFS